MDRRVIKKSYLIISFFSFVISSILYLVNPFLFSYLIDNVILQNNIQSLYLWLITAIIFNILYHGFNFFIIEYMYFKWQNTTTNKNIFNIVNNIFKIHNSDYEKFESGNVYNSMIYHNDTCVGILFRQFSEISANTVVILIYMIVLFLISPSIMLIMILAIPIYVLAIFLNKKKLEIIEANQLEKMDKFVSFTKQIITSKRQINVLKREDFILEKFKNISNDWLKYRLRYWYLSFLSIELPKLATSIFSMIILFVGAIYVINGKLMIGVLVLINPYVNHTLNCVSNICEILIRKISNKSAFIKVGKFYNIDEDKNKKFNEFINFEDDFLKIKDVNIYTPNNDFLFYIEELNINKNGIYYIVGENGVGKSSILNIITNLFNPTLIKNNSKDSYFYLNKDVIANSVYLTYPHFFIEDTIENNILLGNAKTEEFDFFIKILNMQDLDLGKKITLNPVNLSLGQQQKISIARLLIRNYKYLILDEPFSNLDSVTINNLIVYLEEIKKDKIILIISHDDNIKRVSDYVLEINENKLILK